MQIPLAIIAAALLVTLSCQADEPGSPAPASQPAGLHSTVTIDNSTGCVIQIEFTNPTETTLSLGAARTYKLTRIDVNPPQVVASLPEGIRPHLRLAIPPHASHAVTIIAATAPLPDGHYHFTITYAGDTSAIEKDFVIPLPAANPAK